jgi:hypothetical protein
MKNIILLITLFLLPLYSSYDTNVQRAFAIGVFNENGKGENVQHVRKTKFDYNGICYTKVFVIGSIYHGRFQVTIGDSIGSLQSSKDIFNKYKKRVGAVYLFKHYSVTDGFIKVIIDDKLYDKRVFVK